ncbi:MAG: ATP-binding protein [Planctomycetota bacterium]
MIKRYLERNISEDIKEKMVFISGPRQVGKTTVAKETGKKLYAGHCEYLNWDNRNDRKAILSGVFRGDDKLVIFDELHKYKNWKNFIKGEYDKYRDKFHILVTGSARLDVYRKGGDSLLGRYRSYRLHPLSVGELIRPDGSYPIPFKELLFNTYHESVRVFDKLMKFGGFPEIYTKHDERVLRRWHNDRVDRLIKEDIRDVEYVRDISALQVLVELLPGKVGSCFSLNSLREDLNVTHKTVSLWTDILEKFYYHFRVYPYQNSLIKSLRKEPKMYLWDWSEIEDAGIRLENMVACHLLKLCHFLHDAEGYKASLWYLRDKDQREVDFLVSIDGKPWFSVEVKSVFKGVPPAIKYFKDRLKIPFVYEVVGEKGCDILQDNVRIISADKFLASFV